MRRTCHQESSSRAWSAEEAIPLLSTVISEEDWIPVSALEHYSYCPRQYALIHIEGVFEENVYTQRGRFVHERVHTEATHGLAQRIELALPLVSHSLGLIGKADLVEFYGDVPYPVEYKYGRNVGSEHADLQVCAQAMCLEEMFGVPIRRGAVFHHASRRRREVVLTPELRVRVAQVVSAIRALDWRGPLPPPVADGRCRNCSLADACLPETVARPTRLERSLADLFVVENADGD